MYVNDIRVHIYAKHNCPFSSYMAHNNHEKPCTPLKPYASVSFRSCM